MPRALSLGFLAAWMVAGAVAGAAETRFPPPEFENGYTMPSTQHPAPRSLGLEYLDVAALAAALGLATWAVHKKRSRRWIVGLGLASMVYFGFYREGCVCAIGSVQNIALGLGYNGYSLPLAVAAFFGLPLVTALFFGRTFCAAACPHGALQDLILLKPVKVPAWLEQGLGLVPFVYLGLAVLFAATGSAFIICQYDPFIPIFRLSGSTTALALAAGFLVTGLFVGRPYCRFLCPYGALLRIASVVSKWRVRITPDTCTRCTLCAESCPFGVIRQPAASGPGPDLRRAARTRLAWLLPALPLLTALGVAAGGRFGDVLAGANPDVALAQRCQVQAAGKPLTLTQRDQLELAWAQTQPKEWFEAVAQVRSRFHLGGWILGGWLGLIAGCKLLGVASPRLRRDFEPDRAACLGCARCFATCPQEQVRLGGCPVALPATTAAAAPAMGSPAVRGLPTGTRANTTATPQAIDHGIHRKHGIEMASQGSIPYHYSEKSSRPAKIFRSAPFTALHRGQALPTPDSHPRPVGPPALKRPQGRAPVGCGLAALGGPCIPWLRLQMKFRCSPDA